MLFMPAYMDSLISVRFLLFRKWFKSVLSQFETFLFHQRISLLCVLHSVFVFCYTDGGRK